MKTPAEEKPIQIDASRAQAKLSRVVETIQAKGILEGDGIGSDAKIEGGRERRRKFDSSAKRSGVESESECSERS